MKSLIIPPDKSFVYPLPTLTAQYVRTGVMGMKDCFFHCYLRAFHFKYKHMGPSERQQMVKQLREELADHVTLETLRTGAGEHRRMLFFGALRQLLENSQNGLPAHVFITILEQCMSYKDNFYAEFIGRVLDRRELARATMADKQQLVDRVKSLFSRANAMTIAHFKRQLIEEEIGATEIEFISRFLKCNFLFLYETEQGVERYPFSRVLNMDWPFCVLLWVQERHYEIIGRRDPNSIITRVFYVDDEIVEAFAPKNDGQQSAPQMNANG